MKMNVSMKRVLSFLMALVMVLGMLPAGGLHTHAHAAEAVTMTGGEVLYLKPNSNWHVDNARFAAYFFGSNGDGWTSMEPVPDNGGYYRLTVPAGSWTNLIFVRMNPAGAENSWDYRWNQTADLSYDGVNNLFTVPDGYWDGASTGWSTWTPICSHQGHSQTGCGLCGLTEGIHSYDETTHSCDCGLVEEFTVIFQDVRQNEIGRITAPYGSDISAQVAEIVEVVNQQDPGYAFGCWNDRESGELVELTTMPGKNMTIICTYRLLPFDIFYYANGEVYHTSTSLYTSTYMGEEPKTAPTREGYTFTGWVYYSSYDAETGVFSDEYTNEYLMPNYPLYANAQWDCLHGKLEYADHGDGETHDAVCGTCGELMEAALPHEPSTAEFRWPESADDYMDVYVGLNCACGFELDYTYADVELTGSTEADDCSNPGSITYTATAEFGGETYRDTKTYTVPSDNHSALDENGFCACGGYQSADYNEETGVYEISNAGQLYWYAQELNENNAEIYVKLTADITIPENAPNWEPINSSYAYFDGNFKTISGLKCIGGDAQHVGLFGREGWWYEISNLHITDSYFEGCANVGAVVAELSNGGSVTNCYVTDTTVTGDGYSIGGLVGSLSIGNVINCYTDSDTLVGYRNTNYSTLENSYYLSAEETEDGGKTAAQFASGEVAFLLQAGQQPGYDYDEEGNEIEVPATEIWGQKIGVDEFPVLGGQKVYQGYGSCADRGYTNSPNPSPERPDHSGEIKYTPNADGTTHSSAYSCCGEVVTENEAHTQPLTWVNLGEAGHISYYPCCQRAEDAETVPHSYDEATLLCGCGQAHPDAVVLVSIDGTPVRAFTDVEFAAINAVTYTAEDKAVLKLLKSVDLGEGNVNLRSGVYTLDLNGFALTSSDSSSGAVCIYHDADLTICNGTIVGSNNCIQMIEGKLIVSDVTCLEANFGIMMYDGELILRRCDIQTGYGMLVNSGSVTVYDSTFATDQDVDIREDGIITFCEGTEFPGGLSVDGVSLESLLPEGMAYWRGNTMLLPDEGDTEIWGDVTVKAVCTHENSTIVYIPKDMDNHLVAHSCCFSGPLEPHSLYAEGKCTICGFDPANSVIIRMTDSYGDGWGGNAIQIYEDGVLIDTTTVLEGSEASWICAYNPEKEYEFFWVKGNYSSECSFELIVAGESVFTADRNDCNNYNDGYKFFPVCQHVYDEGVVTAPTCTSMGYTTYTCTLCGLSYKDNLQNSLGGHKKAEGDEGDVTAPTCISVGYTSYTCTVCGESYEDNLVDPLAHVLGEDGNCTVCGNLYSIPVYVSGNHVTSYNMADVLGDGTVSYDPTTNTLTLNGYRGSDIYMETSLNILLLGENTIETEDYGIFCYFYAGTVSISGTGSLDIISGYESVYMECSSVTLTIGGSATLNLMGAEEGISLSADTAELVIRDNATVIIGTEEAPMEEECIYVDGIITGSVTITDNASVSCVTNDEEGIFVGGGHSYLTISGNANVYAMVEEEGLDAEFITISGGTVTAIGGADFEGIYTRVLTVSGGTVTAEGEDQGIEAEEIIITGGTITVTGGMIASVGDFMTPGTITLGEDMAITAPEGAILGELDMNDVAEGFVLAVLNPDGTLAETVTISAAESPIRIVTQPTDCEGFLGKSAAFTVEAEGEGLTYQWYYFDKGINDWWKSNSPGSTTDTVSPVFYAYRDGQRYRCVITDAEGNTVTTETVTMTLKSGKPVITGYSGDVDAGALGKTYEFSVSGTGENLTYRWEYSTDGGETWNLTWLDGYDTDTLTVKLNLNRNGNLYRCVISSAGKESVTSEPMGLYLQAESVEILGQPEKAKVLSGETATFTVAAGGNDLSYAWFISSDNGRTWERTDLPGHDTATLSFEANMDSAAKYLCKVTDGSGKTVCSNVAILSILPEILTQPESITCANGKTATFTVEARGDSLKYRWYCSTDGGETWTETWLSGHSTDTLSFVVNAGRAAKIYKCVVTGRYGDVVETAAVSVTIG